MPEISTPVSSRISYRKMGAGNAIILLHGFPSSGVLWRNIQDNLSVGFTVIIPDLPGSGNSVLDKATDIRDMAEIVKAIMDKENIGKAVIAGHSMGGYVAFEFARLYPHRLAGLSLIHSTPLADDEEKKKVRLRSIQLIQNGGKNGFISQMVPNLFSPAFKQSHPLMVKAQIEESLKMEDSGMINFYNAMLSRRDNSAILNNAAYPIQWIFGTDDTLISYKRILEKCYVSNVNFVYFYNDCGHSSMLENPEKLAIDLIEFSNYSYYRLHE